MHEAEKFVEEGFASISDKKSRQTTINESFGLDEKGNFTSLDNWFTRDDVEEYDFSKVPYKNKTIDIGEEYDNESETPICNDLSTDNWSQYPLDKSIIVFTDGSCIQNKNVAGYGIHFPTKFTEDISNPLEGKPTNNRAELTAVHIAVKTITQLETYKSQEIIIFTDSEYTIKCVTLFIKAWEKNNWKLKTGKDVKNRDLIEKISKYIKRYNINFKHVYAHTGKGDKLSLANEIADRLAYNASFKQIK